MHKFGTKERNNIKRNMSKHNCLANLVYRKWIYSRPSSLSYVFKQNLLMIVKTKQKDSYDHLCYHSCVILFIMSKELLRPHSVVKYLTQSSEASSRSGTASSKLREKAVALQKQRKNESINVCGNQFEFFPSERFRKQSILSSVSNVKINKLGRRIDQIKHKLRNIYSPEHMILRHEERSIEKRDNAIAFNYDSTERVYASSFNPKMRPIDSAAFCQTILRDLQKEDRIFQNLQKSIAKQVCGPLKKNERLKAKEYEQMKKSDDGYFKDFFSVLEDKPKHAQQRQKMLTSEAHVQRQQRKGQKAHLSELQNRVKNAINKSKTLINKFKAQR